MFRRLAPLVVLALTAGGLPAHAGIIDSTTGGPFPFQPSPAGAWAYSELPGFQPPGLSTTYFPTSQSAYAGAAFQGYVKSDTGIAAVTGGTGWFGNGLASYQIFSTWVLSDRDQTVHVALSGDDGHSLFVDGQFVGGIGFGGYVDYDLVLTAGVQRRIEIAGYNGPANWVFVFGRPFLPHPDDNPTYRGPLETTPGVTINANGFAVATPEPASLAVFAGVLLVGGVVARRRFGN